MEGSPISSEPWRSGAAASTLRVSDQLSNAQRREVPARFLPLGGGQFGIQVGSYDRKSTLIIDPVLDYSSYLGGSDDEGIFGIGTVFSTFLGGGGFDAGFDVALDPRHNIYVTGYTYSTDFPIVRAFQSQNRGFIDGFVTKLDSQASNLIYSTYIGGSRSHIPLRIAVRANEEASVTGFTSSADFPTHDALSSFGGGQVDAFVVTLDRSGETPRLSTCLGGGSGDDYGYAITIGAGNSIWVGGSTASRDYPLVRAFQDAYAGGPFDAFLSKIVIQDEHK